MAVGKVLPDGQLEVPRDVRDVAGLAPGAEFRIRIGSDRIVQIEALPRLTLAEALDRYRVEGPIEDDGERSGWQAEAARGVFGRA